MATRKIEDIGCKDKLFDDYGGQITDETGVPISMNQIVLHIADDWLYWGRVEGLSRGDCIGVPIVRCILQKAGSFDNFDFLNSARVSGRRVPSYQFVVPKKVPKVVKRIFSKFDRELRRKLSSKKPTSKNRAKCPICSYSIKLRKDGTLYQHDHLHSDSWYERQILKCGGSGKKPKETK